MKFSAAQEYSPGEFGGNDPENAPLLNKQQMITEEPDDFSNTPLENDSIDSTPSHFSRLALRGANRVLTIE